MNGLVNRIVYWVGDRLLGCRVYFPKGISEADINYQDLRESDRDADETSGWFNVFDKSRVLDSTIGTLERVNSRVKAWARRNEEVAGHVGDTLGLGGETRPLSVHKAGSNSR